MSNTFDKLSVLDSFIEEVNSYLPGIETNLERLAQSPGDMDALEEAHRLTHTIGGSASMMDFPGLAHVAHGMEDILMDALEGLFSLDEPAFALLRRSLGRLHRLLEGIRNGIDEEAVIAEDDADYMSFRALQESPSTHSAEDSIPVNNYQVPSSFPASVPQPPDLPVSPPVSSMPSFDEVLASFRTPASIPGEEVGWPEEPAHLSQFDDEATLTSPMPSVSPSSYAPPAPDTASTSALEALVASIRQPSTPPPPVPLPPVEPAAPVPSAYEPSWYAEPSAQAWHEPQELQSLSEQPVAGQKMLPQVYGDVQRDVQTLEAQASSLKDVLTQLRGAMHIIEEQRGEFKGFLNGSKDALDRMEIWAGQAMGLNLRNSPEQVRRYLPLSVMWVANTKLKKVLEALLQVADGIETNDEQLHTAIQQLLHSIDSYGDAFQQMQESVTQAPPQDTAWSPWEVHVSHDADLLRERVTFERQGDPAALRAELEAQIREELRYEYDSRPPVPSREELELQIRNEVRQEYEDRQRLQARLAGPDSADVLRDLEAQLRSEIEIQVRQDFLKQIETLGDISGALSQNSASANNTAALSYAAAQSQPLSSLAPTPPPPTHQPTLATPSTTAYSGDIDEEAAEVFRLEAEEHLQTISTNVASLEKEPTNRDIIQSIRRATHTLKGAAGMMGFRAIADLCHGSEDLLDTVMEGSIAISPAILSIILDTAEALDSLITGRGTEAGNEARAHELQQRYAELLGTHGTELPPAAEEYIDLDVLDDQQSSDTQSTSVVDGSTDAADTSRTPRGELSVRVRLQKLDELVNLFGELLVNRSVLEERIQRLVRLVADVGVSSNRLSDVGQKLESRFEAATLPSGRSVQVMPGEGMQSMGLVASNTRNGNGSSVPAHLEDFDELELDRYTEFHQLARGLSEGISDMTTLSNEMDTIIRECEGVFARENRLSTTFQDRLMKARLVPISSMAPRLYRAARSVAYKQGKDFEFLLEGEATEVDRTVYEEIFGPLLHLMRNAVNHAIEKPDDRVQKGKPPVGQIKLSAGYEGNQIIITVRDDGTGISQESVRRSAISRGLIRPDHPPLSENELVTLIFHPGFSTASVLSEESGRGVGLDVVRDSVSRLRGTLTVESTPGQGTAFTMSFPTSLAIQSVMTVRASGQQFAIPTAHVESIGRLDNFKRATLAGQPAIVVRNDLYPLHMLSQYLSLPVGSIEEKAQIVLVNAGGHRVALAVEEIKGKADIVMKNLGSHLREVHGIAGATVLGNGRVVLVLEMNSLISTRSTLAASMAAAIPVRRDVAPAAAGVRQRIDVAANRTGTSTPHATASTSAAERGKHILVVDDSPSVRRVVSGMLKQHGWEVQTARDGVEALEMISAQTPAAVLLDIEMPRMDGYELTSTVRAQEQYRTLPLIVLTSRAAAKHQQRAIALGANAYVVKPYQDEELLNTINSLVYGAVAH